MTQLFVDKLSVIDFSYFDYQRGILGESWLVDILLTGDLDEQGMLFDFGRVKKQIKSIIDTELDHRFVISAQSENLQQDRTADSLILKWENLMGKYRHESPEEAVAVIDVESINMDSIARYLEKIILKALPKNISSVSLTLSEELIDGAYYHYSHSLKKHDGNCQRIVHGHRSRIEIHENHKRNSTLEDYWAACFRNIYIGTREDIEEELELNGIAHICFSHNSSQGKFSVTMPKKQVYLIDSDSTVELIAEHIARKCSEKKPGNYYQVKAYEGVGKGALFNSE